MKFNCHRCNKPYVIADERVRGKILKIRCKNCAAVMTVREGADTTDSLVGKAPGAASGKSSTPTARRSRISGSMVGAGVDAEAGGTGVGQAGTEARASSQRSSAMAAVTSSASVVTHDRDALSRSASGSGEVEAARSSSSSRPVSDSGGDAGDPAMGDVEEWYLSVEGEQYGPFEVPAACEWIKRQPAAFEIYGWRDGYEDWRPVEEIGVFKGIRSVSRLALAAPPPSSAGMPAFSSRLGLKMGDDDLENARTRVEPNSSIEAAIAAARAGGSAAVNALDLKFDAASRVFHIEMQDGRPNIASVARPNAQPWADAPHPSQAAPGQAAPSAGSSSGRRSVLIFILVVVVALIAIIALALVYMRRDRGPAEEGRDAVGLHVGSDVGSGDVGKRTTASRPVPAVRQPQVGDNGDDVDLNAALSATTATTKTSGLQTASTARTAAGIASGSRGAANASASGQGTEAGNASLLPLTERDIDQQLRHTSTKIGLTRCYERARRKDPFLQVQQIDIELEVKPDGTVGDVVLLNHADSELGRCLNDRVRQWSFRPSTEGLSARVPLVFEPQR